LIKAQDLVEKKEDDNIASADILSAVGSGIAENISIDVVSVSLTRLNFKLDLSPSGMISSLISAFWGLAKQTYINKYKHDISNQEMVERLKDDMTKINEKLDVLLTADLKVAGKRFNEANKWLVKEQYAEAMEKYQNAENNAVEAIERVQKIDQLLQGYKLKLVSQYMILLLKCREVKSDAEKFKKLQDFCYIAVDDLKELHKNPKIVSAIKNQILPPLLGSKSDREKLLNELFALDCWLFNLSQKSIRVSPVLSDPFVQL
jgi:tetratricopeptide (TPR) repeat protein